MCDSLPKYEAVKAFGREFLKAIFQNIKQHLINKFMTEQEKIPFERRELLGRLLPG
jgi:hypothetical protein